LGPILSNSDFAIHLTAGIIGEAAPHSSRTAP
jgi:hypothetical protein